MNHYSVLLVDDEDIVLEDLKTLIDWEANGISHLYTARNATQAFRVLRMHKIDVIFMDILLPGKDGLTLSREILQKYPGIQIVILSAYNEFTYATKGIELGVFRYLLKHELTPQSLTELLAELKIKIENENNNRIMMEEQQLYAFIMGGSGIPAWSRSGLKLENVRLWMGAIVAMQPLVYYLPEKGKYAKRSQMKVSISELMTLEQEEISAKYILSFDDRLLVFAAEEACSLAVFENLLSKMTIHLQEKTEAPVKYLYFSSAYCPAEMKACNEQIKQKIPALIFCSHRSSLSAQEESSGHGDRADTQEALTPARIPGSGSPENDLAAALQNLSEAHRRRDADLFLRITEDIIISIAPDIHPEEVFSGIYYAEDLIPVLEAKVRAFEERKSREEQISPATRFMLRYIDENYRDNISLQHIAGELNANVMYIGRLFQKDMGVSFRTYLNEYRIRLAQKLLRTTNKKVFEISEEVGIPNGQYFSRLFRQQTGCSPNEYRQRTFSGR